MIITSRAASIDFGTDPTARSLRTVLSASERLDVAAPTASSATSVDFEQLYPALFATAPARVRLIYAVRAAVAAVAGIAAVFVTIFHL